MRPPLRAPLIAACPRCGRAFKASVDLRAARPQTLAGCPWCRYVVVLRAPGEGA